MSERARADRRVRKMASWLRWAIFMVLVAAVQPAFAVRCVTSSGATSMTESIGGVASYPTDAPDGYVIWVSPVRTTTGYCFKDLGGRGNIDIDDPISFYANPNKQTPAAWGLEIGIRYEGQDHFGAGSQPGTGVPTHKTVPACTDDELKWGLCPKISINISYQVVVRKRGSWTQPPSDIYTVFQFDGAKGLNEINPSFQYRLSGMRNLKPTPCFVDVLVTPEPGVVDFGSVQAVRNGFLPAVPRKRFSLSLTKKCNVTVKVDGYFETSSPVQNGLLVPAQDSNFGIGIEDSKGKAIPFNEQFTLAQFPSNVMNQSVLMDAVLKSFGPPKIGRFNATATIRLFIY
ncbi:fimbrial protein [Burkholderia sp. AU30198]|uniref:fimbrial protein n=1 Tax=Burkholderia sp. AU30198 TaxID=2879627 RepID=UPI001CF17CC3|nr:fimbrial protein [Burkholderia sp. AU30198]MCA8294651.1 fimbrial protein [Burkholderia sp. AU30198]